MALVPTANLDVASALADSYPQFAALCFISGIDMCDKPLTAIAPLGEPPSLSAQLSAFPASPPTPVVHYGTISRVLKAFAYILPDNVN